MERLLVCLFLCLAATFSLSQSNPVSLVNPRASGVSPVSTQADQKAQARIIDSYGKLPLSFEANHGQTDARVKFLSRTSGYSLFLTGDEAVLALSGTNANKAKVARTAYTLSSSVTATKAGGVLRMKLRNANPAAKVTGVDELGGTSNYFIGSDPAKWRTNVPTYAKVKYEGIYSGIDLVYYGNQRQLEYDFIVAPGADPRGIAFDIRGAKRIQQNVHGDLMFKVGEDEIRWHKPVVYQEKDGTRQEIAAHYAVTDTNQVEFEVAKYDVSRPLYIDPLIYSTYLGGSGNDGASGIAVDRAGNAYLTGGTSSTDFPTMNPLQPANGGQNAFVSKINTAGSALVYSTYLGGNGLDSGYGIAVDSAGNAYVTGSTTATNFPIMNPLQAANGGGSDAFVAEISPTGTALVYSTYLGGSGNDGGNSIAVDSGGNAYVTGYTSSTDFPTMNPLQSVNGAAPDRTAFVAKINASGSALVYSTYLGGSLTDQGNGIAMDGAGNAYVTGQTCSTNFPTMNPLQPTYGGGYPGCGDAFVSKINTTGSALVYSTYLGGNSDDGGNSIAVDSAGNAYVTGCTISKNFPTTPGAFETLCPRGPRSCDEDYVFVTELNPLGSALVYSTYLGGPGGNSSNGIAVDSSGNAYVTGSTISRHFPTKSPLQKSNAGFYDAFVAKFNAAGSALFYSTYLGGIDYDVGNGIAVDSAGDAYVTGTTRSTNFPTMNPLQVVNAGGGGDAFVAKLHISAVTMTRLSSSPNPSIYGQAVTLIATVTSGLGAPPDGETVTFMKGATVLGTGTLSGGSTSLATPALPVGSDNIRAVYGGDSDFASSKSNTVSQVVNKATTTTTLASSGSPSTLGQSVTFTASATPQFGGKVTGNVTFYDGTTALKTVGLSGGVAKFTTSTLVSGAHNITATYNGSTSLLGSSASLIQTVN